MRKVAYYCISTELGGAEKSLLELLLELQKKPSPDFAPWVLLPKSEGPLITELRRHAIAFSVLSMPETVLQISRSRPLLSLLKGAQGALPLLKYLYRLLRLLKEEEPALIHTTGIKCHFLGALSGALLAIPVIWHLRDTLSTGWTPSLLRLTRRLCHPVLIANSLHTARSFDPDRTITVIHNGLDSSRYRRMEHSPFRDQLGVPIHSELIGMVGVFARWKGQLNFVLMAERLKNAFPQAHFVLVGSEIYDTVGESGITGEILKTIDNFGMKDRIHLSGFSRAICDVYSSLDVFVHASVRPEPFGRVILEAMACQTPIVAANAGGIPEILSHNVNGLLYTPGSVDEMTEKVSDLLLNKEKALRLAQNGFTTFQRHFSLHSHAEKILLTYDQVLTRKPSS